MGDVSPGSLAVVFLRQPPKGEAQAGQHFCRDRRGAGAILGQEQLEQLRDGALLDKEVAVDEGLAKVQFRIEQDPSLRRGRSEPYRNREAAAVTECSGDTIGCRYRETSGFDKTTKRFENKGIHGRAFSVDLTQTRTRMRVDGQQTLTWIEQTQR